jgi:hypothetical protein
MTCRIAGATEVAKELDDLPEPDSEQVMAALGQHVLLYNRSAF